MWKDAPAPLKQALIECINAILDRKANPPPSWLGGLIRFLFKKGNLLDIMMLFSFASIFALFARKGPFLARPHQLFAIFYVSIPRSPIEAVGIVTCICSSLAKKNIIHSLSMHSICIQNVLSSQRLRNLRWPLGRDCMYRLRPVPSPVPALISPSGPRSSNPRNPGALPVA